VRLLVAGGGTGGHLFPGIAIADEVASRGDSEVLFVGTSRGIETRAVPAVGYELETLEVSGLKRMGVLGTLRGLARLPLALWKSLAILRRFRPDVVMGVGGYASGPMVLVAALTGYPTAIQEQNSVPGITNRILGRVVRVVITAFDGATRFFPARKIEKLGNPVRKAIVAALENVGDRDCVPEVQGPAAPDLVHQERTHRQEDPRGDAFVPPRPRACPPCPCPTRLRRARRRRTCLSYTPPARPGTERAGTGSGSGRLRELIGRGR
jgi:hypothetical protein